MPMMGVNVQMRCLFPYLTALAAGLTEALDPRHQDVRQTQAHHDPARGAHGLTQSSSAKDPLHHLP